MSCGETSTLNNPTNSDSGSSGGCGDIFCNSSKETVIQCTIRTNYAMSVCKPSDSSLIVEALVGNNEPSRQFCFFCSDSFIRKFDLSWHLKTEHCKELAKLLKNKLEILSLHSCPFCKARFYVKSLLPQHLLQDHCDVFSQIFKKSVSKGKVCCPFCEYKVLSAFENLLSHHVNEKHLSELEDYLTSHHSTNIQSETFVHSLSQNLTLDSPGLCEKFAHLDTNGPVTVRHGKLKEGGKRLQSARRGLFIDKENLKKVYKVPISISPNHTPKKTSCWRSSAVRIVKNKKPTTVGSLPKKRQVRFTTSTPKTGNTDASSKVKRQLMIGDYKCGACKIYFSCNQDLVQHVKCNHNAIKAFVHPLFGCGECQAAFFKNSYIKRHRRFHHTYNDNLL